MATASAMQRSRMMPGPMHRTKAGGARETNLSGLGISFPFLSSGLATRMATGAAADQKVVAGPNGALERARLEANTQLELQRMKMTSDIAGAIFGAGAQIGSAYMTSEAQIKAVQADRKSRMAELALQWQAIGAGQMPPISRVSLAPRPAFGLGPGIFILVGAGILIFLLMR